MVSCNVVSFIVKCVEHAKSEVRAILLLQTLGCLLCVYFVYFVLLVKTRFLSEMKSREICAQDVQYERMTETRTSFTCTEQWLHSGIIFL